MASAEQALNDKQEGVRDEIGFLALHAAFSDWFFPGTSVLHTRLRYVLFVPWLMERSVGDAQRFHADSLQLTRQLVMSKQIDPKADTAGVIGSRDLKREPAQTPAMMYWSALARWGILQPRLGSGTPTRTQVLKRLALKKKRPEIVIDGGRVWSTDHSPFVRLPPPPENLLQNGARLDFKLTREEKKFLRRQLMAVRRDDNKQSLLGRLAEECAPVDNADTAWHLSVRLFADSKDKSYLGLSKGASSLAGIGRAVYLALVEQAKNRDTSERNVTFRDDLARMRSEHEKRALALDLDALATAFPTLPPTLMAVLRQTQAWLRTSRPGVNVLQEVYDLAEHERKGTRARLGSTLGAQRRRAEWNTPQAPSPMAAPLHYRWSQVRRLLDDLASA